ncbi:low molecular weight protein-tyrosine-phosphatase [Riemerella columbipharyngis]|uniref:protein-tyrosine-phosphatase n=1 Tax=Riemerella columbipharyngis TaxID=1071918 RepID=A0A1G6ZC32_9FLAO|nr:low molecular weight protein-tyrosine-phosphatase [Riemerella columbipharyngis]SDD99286.1 protein-tyrosine phosphatase [Riemerella columbipharyngis]
MKILMVCLGNICRSPLAEGILRSKINDKHLVDSAGTINFHEGEKADYRSIEVAKNHNIDISMHRSRPITKEDLNYFDRIYCMDKNNYKNVLAMAENQEQKDKIMLILDNDAEVPDPYYGDINDFEKVFQILDKACDTVALKIN